MLYRKYRAIGYLDRARKDPPFDGFETDYIAKMYEYLWNNRRYDVTYEFTCRDNDEIFIITPEQVKDLDKLFQTLAKIVGECNCE